VAQRDLSELLEQWPQTELVERQSAITVDEIRELRAELRRTQAGDRL
jgi:hypothetical protein